ncbi:formylglycine-generating enzyme family protein [Bowmanella denitrificans]|uniref:formylglycine-generating enzyme family protein n=1 Tax=Bowmanella denitrificans TaxID=366582 RepID=UPI000C9BD7CB|nr:SUMF1/EgtB/PvdO family nonheme iron enzyme [Bowmanella denitrificans]
MSNWYLSALCVLSICSGPVAWAEEFITPPMVSIPAGEFMMGTIGGDPASQPIHEVSVEAFQLAKYPVTVAEFRYFAKDTNFSPDATCNDFIDKEGLRGPTHIGTGRWDKHRYSHSDYQPVTCISLTTAKAYAKWLSQKTGTSYRLPSEQEWEYAARAGSTSRFFWGDDPTGAQACEYGNVADFTGESVNNQLYGLSNVGFVGLSPCEDGEAYNAIVGQYKANRFGLHDMTGNVLQMVNSCYSDKGYQLDTSAPQEKNQCEFYGLRGSNWHYPARPHTFRGRAKREGWNVSADIGFRLAADKAPATSDDSHFTEALKQAQQQRLAEKDNLLMTPRSGHIVQLGETRYQLRWQPVTDKRVTRYDIYQSVYPQAHLMGGFYQHQYTKLTQVDSSQSSLELDAVANGTSFLLVAANDGQSSLPSAPLLVPHPPVITEIPGKLEMQNVASLNGVALYRAAPTETRPERYYVFKTNPVTVQERVSITFLVKVEESGEYQLSYQGRTFQEGTFFTLWNGATLLAEIRHERQAENTTNQHSVYLEKGQHSLQLQVMREGFDRWMLAGLEFTLQQPIATGDE